MNRKYVQGNLLVNSFLRMGYQIMGPATLLRIIPPLLTLFQLLHVALLLFSILYTFQVYSFSLSRTTSAPHLPEDLVRPLLQLPASDCLKGATHP